MFRAVFPPPSRPSSTEGVGGDGGRSGGKGRRKGSETRDPLTCLPSRASLVYAPGHSLPSTTVSLVAEARNRGRPRFEPTLQVVPRVFDLSAERSVNFTADAPKSNTSRFDECRLSNTTNQNPNAGHSQNNSYSLKTKI